MATSLYAAPVMFPGGQESDNNGSPLNGGKVYVYQAGTTSDDYSYPTYSDALAGSNANANPVVLDSNGRAQIWLQAERKYKLVVKDSTAATTFQTMDNYSPGQAYPGSFLSDWVQYTAAPTYASATTFTVSGDQTATFHPTRRLKFTVSGGTVYGTVQSVAFSVATTTVTMIMDSTSLDSGLSAVWYGILTGPGATSYPPSYRDKQTFVKAYRASSAQTLGGSSWTKIQFNAETIDALGEFDSTTNYRFTPLYQGAGTPQTPACYLMMAQLTLVGSITSCQIALYRDGSAINVRKQNTGIAGGTISIEWLEEQQVGTGHYYEIFANPSAGVDIDYDSDTTWFHIRRIQ